MVEDTDITFEELAQEFPPAVIEALRLLTHEAGKDYFTYVREIEVNPVAKVVKLADLAHNSDESRFAGCEDVTMEQLTRWRKKYAKAKAILLEDEDRLITNKTDFYSW